MSNTKKRARRQISNEERRTAKLMGGRKTALSGSGDEKGDGRALGRWRSENKETAKRSISIKDEVWEKIASEALSGGERPVLFLKMKNRAGRPIRLVVISEDDFTALIEGEEDW